VNLSDLHAGLSLHFVDSLTPGSGNVENGEHANSHPIAGRIVPTPQEDWELLKDLASLPERSEPNPNPQRFVASYVPYRDGRFHYHEGNEAVLSAEYSGCLMAVYRANNQRRVAHIPKSNVVLHDCIGEFRDYFAAHSTLTGEEKGNHAKTDYEFLHYFQPFKKERDEDIQIDLISKLLKTGYISQLSKFSVFGLVTALDNSCGSIWAVKAKVPPPNGEMWHVLMVRTRAPVRDFRAMNTKVNRAALQE